MKDILSHAEITIKEGFPLQRGMNFRPKNKKYSILLMSTQENSPYNDGFEDNGNLLIYEGEDINRRESNLPKKIDQPFFTKTGKLSNNALFFKAAEDYKSKRRKYPEKVQIYEKISNNVWADKGMFLLVDAEYLYQEFESRKVFKFHLVPSNLNNHEQEDEDFEFSRRIPTDVKREVWERDGGKCRNCGSDKNLHFDHIIPFSKGGTSNDVANIQILCAKCNLSKSNKII